MAKPARKATANCLRQTSFERAVIVSPST